MSFSAHATCWFASQWPEPPPVLATEFSVWFPLSTAEGRSQWPVAAAVPIAVPHPSSVDKVALPTGQWQTKHCWPVQTDTYFRSILQALMLINNNFTHLKIMVLIFPYCKYLHCYFVSSLEYAYQILYLACPSSCSGIK